MFLKKLRIELLSYRTSDYLPKEYESTNLKYMHHYVHHSIVYNCQDTETTRVPSDGWLDKHVVYVNNGKLFCHEKDEILSFATTWMDLEGIVPSEISQKEKWFKLYVE